MTTFSEQYKLAKDIAFVDRVQQALIKVAVTVSAENPGKRIPAAQEIVRKPREMALLVAFGVVGVNGISEKSSDAEIEVAVRSVINVYTALIPEPKPVVVKAVSQPVVAKQPWYKRVLK